MIYAVLVSRKPSDLILKNFTKEKSVVHISRAELRCMRSMIDTKLRLLMLHDSEAHFRQLR